MNEKLDVVDRCDRCGAQAYVRVTIPAGDLYFCGHDFNANEVALRTTATNVHDERSKLVSTS